MMGIDLESLRIEDVWIPNISPGKMWKLNVSYEEMIPNCATCPGFYFCENPAKLGTGPYAPSIAIKYDIRETENPPSLKVQINENKRPEVKHAAVPIPQTISDHPLDSWMKVNPERLPLYGSSSRNIFLQLQDKPMPGSAPGDEDEEEAFRQNPFLFLPLPAPDDLPVDENAAYIFSSRMDSFFGFQDCFSSAYKSLYLLSATHRVLRHALFAFVRYLNNDDRVSQEYLCYSHITKVIPQLQNSLLFLNFDEGHILTIPLLAYLALWWRNIAVAKKHLKGFYDMLLHAQFLKQDETGKVSVTNSMSSLMLLMWRISIRLDHFFSFMRPEEQTFAPIKSDPQASVRYITEFIDPSASEWTDWLVINDQLEDVRNLVVQYNRRATGVRVSSDFTPEQSQQFVENAGGRIIRKLNTLDGIISSAATAYNENYHPIFEPLFEDSLEPFPGSQYMHYPIVFRSLHHRFIEAILVNRAMVIHSTITSYPKAGAYPPERLQAAIEICCAYLALKEREPFPFQGRGKILEALLFAGYAFCGPDFASGKTTICSKFTIEFQWIQKRLADEAECGHAGAGRMRRLLEISWNEPDGTVWSWANLTFG